jgi:phage/conjugal plasmid C-4 type zinc finger TraR family protein
VPDEFDQVQRHEEQHRAASLRRVLAPLRQDGRDDCEDCGAPIPLERRDAMPSATRCVDCQRGFERVSR